jgi:protein phosphatase
VDIGQKRPSNEDAVICCPDYGFFAVTDGMGGLYGGGETAEIIALVLPGLIEASYQVLMYDPRPERAAELLKERIRLLSDSIYMKLNQGGPFAFGATLCAVWLVGTEAIFVNLGDSRGYLLKSYKRQIRQVTHDHNVAAQLVESGELSPEVARRHPASASLSRFVGMKSPALPETFIEKFEVGDRILLCSDGLYGMVEEQELPALLRSSRSPSGVTDRLIREANLAGGADNISAVYIKALPSANVKTIET